MKFEQNSIMIITFINLSPLSKNENTESPNPSVVLNSRDGD